MFVLDDIAKAILGYLPRSGTATVRALTYNLYLTEEDVRAGLHTLMAYGLIDQIRLETYFLTEDGVLFRARRALAPPR